MLINIVHLKIMKLLETIAIKDVQKQLHSEDQILINVLKDALKLNYKLKLAKTANGLIQPKSKEKMKQEYLNQDKS